VRVVRKNGGGKGVVFESLGNFLHPALAARIFESLGLWDRAVRACMKAKPQLPLEASANCVVLAGKREGQVRMAACLVLATTRADVNGVARRWLDVRKISFAPMDEAVALTGMEYGGITPIGLPIDWPILVDSRVIEQQAIVIGSGVRRSKIVLPGASLAEYPGVHVLEGLANPV
jgi:prolyl-tRNA editing enzyme YbaK/EbsC (Cys-tRNA(Pro) deacylase)